MCYEFSGWCANWRLHPENLLHVIFHMKFITWIRGRDSHIHYHTLSETPAPIPNLWPRYIFSIFLINSTNTSIGICSARRSARPIWFNISTSRGSFKLLLIFYLRWPKDFRRFFSSIRTGMSGNEGFLINMTTADWTLGGGEKSPGLTLYTILQS